MTFDLKTQLEKKSVLEMVDFNSYDLVTIYPEIISVIDIQEIYKKGLETKMSPGSYQEDFMQ